MNWNDVHDCKWVKTEDRLPSLIGAYLIYLSTGEIAWAFFNSKDDFINCQDQCCWDEVTHWMPLPKPPVNN